MNVYVTIELVAIIFLFSVIWFSCPIFTLLICKAFCQLQQITMKPSLKGIRKSDFVELSIGIILTCGLIVQQIGHFLTMAPLLESFPKSAIYLNVLFSWIITILFSVFIFILPAVLLLIWMNNYEEYFTHNNLHDNEVLLWVETSINIYKYSLSLKEIWKICYLLLLGRLKSIWDSTSFAFLHYFRYFGPKICF